MTSVDQLKTLLKNAIEEGFTSEDIEDLARDIEAEQEEKEEFEAWIDNLQRDAASALTEFLEALDYFEDDTDYDEDEKAIYDALQLVREGKLNVNVKKCGNGCSCSASYHDSNIKDEIEDSLDDILKRLKKLYGM